MGVTQRLCLEIAFGQYPRPPGQVAVERSVSLSLSPQRSLISSDLGSFMQLFERHDWDFIEDISSNYGSVVKLHDLVGVSDM